jgi:hypothetical protein
MTDSLASVEWSQMNILTSFLHKIESLFKKPAVEAAFNTVAEILTIAEPIVAEIAALTPGGTLAEVVAAYAKYAVPVVTAIANNPTAIGNALLNLGTSLVMKTVKNPASVPIVQTAVQIAVVALKAAA